jgi:hypothetical protein
MSFNLTQPSCLSATSVLGTFVTFVAVGVARVLVELVLVDVVQLRASKRVGDAVDLGADLVLGGVLVCEKAGEDVGELLNGELHGVTHEVVALEECRAVEDAAGEVSGLNSGECVNLSGVAADGQELGVLECHVGKVDLEVGDGVLVDKVTLVPVVWNTLVARGVLEVTVLAGDGEELLENFAVKLALRVFRGLVSHEAVDEGVRSRLH